MAPTTATQAAATSAEGAAPAASGGVLSSPRFKKVATLASYLTLWYAFNAGFNVTNKQILNRFAFPWIVSLVQVRSARARACYASPRSRA